MTTTPLAQHREANADAGKLAAIRERIAAAGVEAAEFTMLPDLDTSAVLPWDTKVARFFCRLYEPGHRADGGGQALSCGPGASPR